MRAFHYKLLNLKNVNAFPYIALHDPSTSEWVQWIAIRRLLPFDIYIERKSDASHHNNPIISIISG